MPAVALLRRHGRPALLGVGRPEVRLLRRRLIELVVVVPVPLPGVVGPPLGREIARSAIPPALLQLLPLEEPPLLIRGVTRRKPINLLLVDHLKHQELGCVDVREGVVLGDEELS